MLEFIGLMKGQYKAALLGIFVSVLASLSSMALMATAGWFLTAMALAGFAGYALDIFTPSAMIRMFALLRTALRYFDRLFSHDATFKIIEVFKVRMFEKAVSLPHMQSLAFKNSDIERRMRADIDKLELAYLKEFMPFACAFIVSLCVGFFMCQYSVEMALVTLSCMAVSGVVIPVFLSYLTSSDSLKINELSRDLTSLGSDFILGLFDLMALGVEEKFEKQIHLKSVELALVRKRLVLIEGINTAVLAVTINFACLCSVLVGIPLFTEKKIDSSNFIMLAILSIAAFEVIIPLAAACINYVNVRRSATLVFEVLKGRSDDLNDNGQKIDGIAKLSFDNVGFSYDGSRQVLQNVCLEFEKDKNYVIRGRSGHGKTTLIMLMLSLIKPSSGSIRVDGRDLSEIDIRSYRERFSVALQDNALFSSSLFDIFKMVKTDVTEQEIMEVLKKVELDDFVKTLPNGFNEWLGNTGMAVSGGQAKRLSLARALLIDSDFLILDEVAEGLDVKQEKRIIDNILTSRKGVIIITHKQAGLDLCDKIIEL
ncbi:thiol reductant ABC exporter subunit CydC [Anaerobiospirillum thomasii]|uniref:Probable ABC transporter ATP-binding protein HI_0664 n=1 Tax=Anaerobiospirillum thomasii TaxID=179995 RepID=A0A2X0V3L8_9GAMM|nr:thiol reductant ABC exporter subunit CydC [Anaerobiospirillum thomasii]SPT69119.1 Probable ABC transporter ATP-binding protein HI_0664 [Anaerobiospirillum thomasii]